MAKIGIQISSFKPLMTTAESVMDVFTRTRQIGYETIQVQWVDPSVPDEAVKDALVKNNWDCLSTQEFYELYVPQIDKVIEQNLLWGSKDICISGIPKEYRTIEGIKQETKEIKELLPKVMDKGLTLSFHPRKQEYDLWDGVTGTDWILENTPDEFRICLDIYHTEAAKQDTIALLKKYQGRIDMVHFKDDMYLEDGTRTLCPIGQGRIDWLPIIKAVNETGVKYALAEQEAWHKDPFQCMKESYDYMIANGIEK